MQQAVQIQTAHVPQVIDTGRDPMMTRWGINTSVRDKFIDGEKAGFAELPFGQWFQISHFTTPEEIHSTDDDPKFARERMVTKTALSAERYLDNMLGGKTLQGVADPKRVDYGIRFGFYGESDEAKMAVISSALLPSLPLIRQFAVDYKIYCPIDARCQGEDTADFGERDSCPSCWLSWIESELCDVYLQDVSTNGLAVTITNIVTGSIEQTVRNPTMDELTDARATVIESLRRGIVANQPLWTTIAKELEAGERRGFDAYQNNIRKDLHAPKPADAQMAQIERYARAVQQQPSGGNDALLASLAQSQMQTNALLGQLVQQGLSPDAAAKVVEAQVQAAEVVANGEFLLGGDVICDGEPGMIAEIKTAGWYVVQLDSGETKTVRKDKLTREN